MFPSRNMKDHITVDRNSNGNKDLIAFFVKFFFRQQQLSNDKVWKWQGFGIYELDLSNYCNRLITFSEWPLDAPVSALRLAAAGFYSCKNGTQVECFSCGLSVSDWSPPDNNPQIRHKELSPLCVFLNSNKQELATDGSEYILEFPTLNGELNDVTKSNPEDSVHESSAKFNEVVDIENSNTKRISSSSSYLEEDNADGRQNIAIDRTDTQRGENASRRGLSIDQPVDNISTQETEKVPVSLPTDTASNQNASDNSIFRQEPGRSDHLHEVDYSLLDYQNFAMAKHPQYESLKSRLETYRSWSYHNVQHPQRLVEAGFYYTGLLDVVRCYHCDIGLAKWAVEDDPWVEHARHGPQCYFLREKQGLDFVDNVQRSWREIYKPKQPKIKDFNGRNFTFKRWPINLDQLAADGFYYTDDSDTLKNDANRNALSMAASISVLEMGYRKTTLIMAINEYLKRTGNRNFTTEDLLDVILETNTDELQKDDDETEKSSSEIDNKEVRQGKKQIKNKFFLCKMCKVRDSNTVFLTCGHLETCELCAEKTMICFTCGDFVNKKIKTLLS